MKRQRAPDRPDVGRPQGRHVRPPGLLAVFCAGWLGLAAPAPALEPAPLAGVREWRTDQGLEPSYQALYTALEAHRFFVVFEADLGRNLARFRERWGEDYNRRGLGGIRSLVFCNPWYANQAANADPRLLALCPMRIVLIEQQGQTRVVFARPGVMAAGSPGQGLLEALEAAVVKAVEAGLDATATGP